MPGKNCRDFKTNQKTTTNLSSPESNSIANRAREAVRQLLYLCLSPDNSDDESSPRNSHPANMLPTISAPGSSTNAQQNATPELTKAIQAIVNEEDAARQSIAIACDDELLQTEALFCVTSEKQDFFQQENAGRNVLFSKQLFLMHLPVAKAIQDEEEQARTELKDMFWDDRVIAESGISQSQLFKHAAPKKNWTEWAAGFLPGRQ